MKITSLSQTICIATAGFLSISPCFAQQIINGGVQNIGNSQPPTIVLNTVYNAMTVMMDSIKTYFDKNNTCPPANEFSEQSQNLSIYNGAACDVIVTFSNKNPGQLSGKTIRMVIKNGSTKPSDIDFSFQQTITNIDFGANGIAPSFLLSSQKPYTYSYTMMPSSFGNVPSAGTMNVLHDTYEQIVNSTTTANSTSSTSSSTAPSNTYTINPV